MTTEQVHVLRRTFLDELKRLEELLRIHQTEGRDLILIRKKQVEFNLKIIGDHLAMIVPEIKAIFYEVAMQVLNHNRDLHREIMQEVRHRKNGGTPRKWKNYKGIFE